MNSLTGILVLVTLALSLNGTTSENKARGATPSTLPERGAAVTRYSLLCFLPVPMKSHQILLEPLLRELCSRGHHVTLVTPMPMADPPPSLEQVVIINQYDNLTKILKMQGLLDRALPWRLAQSIADYQEGIYQDPAVIEFLSQDRHFDGIIMETMVSDVFIGLHHKYQASVIDVMPLPHFHWSYYLTGIPFDTSYIVDTMAPFTDRMSFTERLLNTLLSLGERLLGELFLLPLSQGVMDRHLRYPGWEGRPSLRRMIANVSVVLLNTHFSLSYPYPLPPHAKEIAGLNLPKPKPLPQDLQEFMDSAEDGVVVFSFGSHISMEGTLGPAKVDIFKKEFARLRQKVLWKTDEDMSDVAPNVRLTKWSPQADLLGHPKVRLFISHCGFHSALEATLHGLPVLAIPVQGDQTKNSRMLTHYGQAATLTLDNITADSLRYSMELLLTQPSFKEAAKRRSEIFQDQRESPLDTAVYWVEYALRHHGAHHLKPAVLSLSFYQQAMLDVYAALAVAATTLLVLLWCFLKCLCAKTTSQKSSLDKRKHE